MDPLTFRVAEINGCSLPRELTGEDILRVLDSPDPYVKLRAQLFIRGEVEKAIAEKVGDPSSLSYPGVRIDGIKVDLPWGSAGSSDFRMAGTLSVYDRILFRDDAGEVALSTADVRELIRMRDWMRRYAAPLAAYISGIVYIDDGESNAPAPLDS